MKSVRFGLVALLLSGCAHDPTMREIGTASGAVVGGLVGNALIGNTAGTLIGAGAGALVGNEIGGRQHRRTQANANRAQAAHRPRKSAPVKPAGLERDPGSATSL
jgi:osmotically inducible lipoprotein OsmB